jgi:hypothetical protein
MRRTPLTWYGRSALGITKVKKLGALVVDEEFDTGYGYVKYEDLPLAEVKDANLNIVCITDDFFERHTLPSTLQQLKLFIPARCKINNLLPVGLMKLELRFKNDSRESAILDLSAYKNLEDIRTSGCQPDLIIAPESAIYIKCDAELQGYLPNSKEIFCSLFNGYVDHKIIEALCYDDFTMMREKCRFKFLGESYKILVTNANCSSSFDFPSDVWNDFISMDEDTYEIYKEKYSSLVKKISINCYDPAKSYDLSVFPNLKQLWVSCARYVSFFPKSLEDLRVLYTEMKDNLDTTGIKRLSVRQTCTAEEMTFFKCRFPKSRANTC